MQRQIKFRAWNKLWSEMVYRLEFSQYADGSVGITTVERGGKTDDFVLMQFTGLSDKNDREIYEGDIVKVAGRKRIGEYVTVIEWRHGSICLERNDTYFINEKAWVFCEVIGNIYENSDLLPCA